MPIYFRPYMLFSIQVPNASQADPSESVASGILSPNFSMNLTCFLASSYDTPRIQVPAFLNSSASAVNACASAVQPDVSSLG
jgi:hypothetical protein